VKVFDDVTTMILAGGRGRRVGGRDKGLVDVDGSPLIEHAIAIARGVSDRIVVSCNRNLDRYSRYGYPVHADARDGYHGPLEGIASCAPLVMTTYTFVIPCDAPHLSPAIAGVLHHHIGECDVAVAHDGTRLQPLVFLARTSALQSLRDRDPDARRSAHAWVTGVRHVVVPIDTPGWFTNLNEPVDFDD